MPRIDPPPFGSETVGAANGDAGRSEAPGPAGPTLGPGWSSELRDGPGGDGSVSATTDLYLRATAPSRGAVTAKTAH